MTKASLARKRRHEKDARADARRDPIPSALCRGYPQAVVRVMEESLQGDPQTIFVEDGSNENTGARGFKYFRARSSNADWWQGLPDKLDRKELRYAMGRVSKCEPLNFKRIEHRWLKAFVEDARVHGWCAAFDGKASPLCVDPEPPMKRAKLGPGYRRVWLALAQADYARLIFDARAVHESPNLFVTGILRDRWHEAAERAAIQGDDAPPVRRSTSQAPRPDDIPF